jgi:cytochrome c-type biogenesis protein
VIELLSALASAVWLGILTSISPCPMATNIAAISFIGRRVGSPRKVLLTGLLYTVGRAMTYVVIGVVLTASILSASSTSHALQKYMNKFLGPMLILVGMVLLDLIQIRTSGRGVSATLQKRAEKWGMWGALLLGVVFAASFCPISAALFFGSLLASAVRVESVALVPLFYGIGTALPVLVFSIIIAVGGKSLGSAFNKLTVFEKWARTVTGAIFILVGLYYSLRYIFVLF